MKRPKRHAVVLEFIKLKDHHGETYEEMPVCLSCLEQVVRMMSGVYRHAKDVA